MAAEPPPRFVSEISPLIDWAFAAAEEPDEHFAAIRRFFLEPQEAYSVEELAALWRISTGEIADICYDRLADGPVPIEWADALSTAVTYSLLRPYDVERALGEDFVRVRGERWKTVPIVIHPPRFVAEAFAPDAPEVSRLALASSIEQFLFEFFTREYAPRGGFNEVPER